MAEIDYTYLEDEINPIQKAYNKTYQKKCDRCSKKYNGTRYQRWCGTCRVTIKNNYWEEYEPSGQSKTRRTVIKSYK